MSILVPAHIFRAYDIRGRVSNELTEDVVQVIGQAFANEAAARGTQEVAVAGDVRLSTESLKGALVEGLTHGGVNVVDIGIAPTPVLYFAVEHLNTRAGIVVTGSHNPPEFNGLKFVLERIPFAGEELRGLHDSITRGRLEQGAGSRRTTELLNAYIARICSDVVLSRPIRIGIDCGNGVTGVVAPRLFEKLGCEVHSLYSEPDGNFPNHHPDPVKPANLKDLIDLVRTRELELGIAFDGDGDRLGVVTKTGAIVSADTLMAYYARDVLRQNPNAPIVFDVKCSNALSSAITTLGGQPVMSKTGHTNIKEKIRELGAPLGGEFSGHICFADRWYGFDDALYSAARLLELLSNAHHDMDQFLETIPARYSTSEIEIHADDDRKFSIIEQLQTSGGFGTGNVLTIDGLRVDFKDAWGLVRASNTSPNLTMRFEANSPAALDRVQKLFLSELAKVAPDLSHAIKT